MTGLAGEIGPRRHTAKQIADARVRAVNDGWGKDTAAQRNARIKAYREQITSPASTTPEEGR